MESAKKHVHILGIGGSAASGIAQIAKAYGYEVTGCDRAESTPYIEKAQKAGIHTFVGHDAAHLEGIDIVAVSPALLYQNNDHPEMVAARDAGKLMTWQQFLGEYLHKDKFVICIAGTHGKSTTTTLAGLVLESADLDPTVEVGATVPAWHNNVRIPRGTSGQVAAGKYFVSEADEFNDNFKHYHPDVIVLNNIEMDHPEYFKTEENMLAAFQRFIDQLKPGGTLIYNTDSALIHKLRLPQDAIAYTASDFEDANFTLSVPGTHNRSNALGVIALARLLHIPDDVTARAIKSFTGLARRVEFIGESNGIKVYDDYANHPTAFAASIASVKELNPQAKVWAVIEPHTYSRLRAVLPELPASVASADEVIVSKIYASREQDPGDFTGADIVNAMQHPHARYIPAFADVVTTIKAEAKPGDLILVMGSGDSYKLARDILATH
jgi:UDP-N-acetylmuramate--alanine ligase